MRRRSGFGWLELVAGILLIALGIWAFMDPGLALAGMVIHAAKFRCPACGRHISVRVPLSITHCPFCGAVLEDKEARK